MTDFADHPSLDAFANQTANPRALGFDAGRLARIGAWMDRYVDDGKLPYAMTAILRGGEVAYLDHRGFTDPETRQAPAVDHLARFYSMTKPIVTAAAMTFYEEARFQLEDPISRFLPEFSEPRVYVSGEGDDMETWPADGPITMRQLMTHTAGLTYGFFDPGPIGAAYRKHNVNYFPGKETAEQVTKRAAWVPLLFEPGSQWTYSIATDVLGRVVEVLGGKPLGEILRERIFAPLEMADTFFGVPQDQVHRFVPCYEKAGDGMKRSEEAATSRFVGPQAMESGGGGLISTLPDYIRFQEMMRRGGMFGDVRILGRKTVDLMMSNHLGGDIASMGQSHFSEMPMVGIGFGLGGSVLLDPAAAQIPGSPGEFAWGGVASTGFWIDRAEELSVIFLTQLTPSSSWPLRRELRVLTYQALLD
jgi:CubicO group peptidase (beta-lactamase class C family)